jgi:hypothetical protein
MESPTPLARKLKLKPGQRAAVVGGPPGYGERLGPPDGTIVRDSLDGPLDWVRPYKPGEARQTFR